MLEKQRLFKQMEIRIDRTHSETSSALCQSTCGSCVTAITSNNLSPSGVIPISLFLFGFHWCASTHASAGRDGSVDEGGEEYGYDDAFRDHRQETVFALLGHSFLLCLVGENPIRRRDKTTVL